MKAIKCKPIYTVMGMTKGHTQIMDYYYISIHTCRCMGVCDCVQKRYGAWTDEWNRKLYLWIISLRVLQLMSCQTLLFPFFRFPQFNFIAVVLNAEFRYFYRISVIKHVFSTHSKSSIIRSLFSLRQKKAYIVVVVAIVVVIDISINCWLNEKSIIYSFIRWGNTVFLFH
jgi:hypothetical protein